VVVCEGKGAAESMVGIDERVASRILKSRTLAFGHARMLGGGAEKRLREQFGVGKPDTCFIYSGKPEGSDQVLKVSLLG
jgi:hypothetical protein